MNKKKRKIANDGGIVYDEVNVNKISNLKSQEQEFRFQFALQLDSFSLSNYYTSLYCFRQHKNIVELHTIVI